MIIDLLLNNYIMSSFFSCCFKINNEKTNEFQNKKQNDKKEIIFFKQNNSITKINNDNQQNFNKTSSKNSKNTNADSNNINNNNNNNNNKINKENDDKNNKNYSFISQKKNSIKNQSTNKLKIVKSLSFMKMEHSSNINIISNRDSMNSSYSKTIKNHLKNIFNDSNNQQSNKLNLSCTKICDSNTNNIKEDENNNNFLYPQFKSQFFKNSNNIFKFSDIQNNFNKFQTSKNIDLKNLTIISHINGNSISNIESFNNNNQIDSYSSSIQNITKIFVNSNFLSPKKKKKNLKPLLFDSKYESDAKKNNMDSNIIYEEEINKSPKLILTEINKSNIFFGKTLKIDASGYQNGLRKKRDGFTFFGIKNKKNHDEEILNDFIINFNKKNNIKNLDRIFTIYYNKQTGHYYIENLNKDLKQNKYFMYVKIYNEFYINENYFETVFMLLGHLLVSVTVKGQKLLTIKVYKNKIIDENISQNNNNSENKKFFVEYNYTSKRFPITIGRENCTINAENKFLSRQHCVVYYDFIKEKWCICDGNGKGKKSSHGTWIMLNKKNKFEFNENDEFYDVKIGEQKFKILINNES